MPEDHPLAPALRLAGLALAHAVWSIEDGEPLSTLALIQRSGGSRELHRYDAQTVADSLDSAISDVAGQLASGGKAAVVFEGYVTPEGGERTDALIVDVFGRDAEVLGRIVQPYRPARRSRIPSRGRAGSRCSVRRRRARTSAATRRTHWCSKGRSSTSRPRATSDAEGAPTRR